MKNVICCGVALAAAMAGTNAQAADLSAAPYKAAPMMPSSWTGLYAGFGVGFRAVRSDAGATSESIAGVPQNLGDGRPTSQSFDSAGFRASPYVGYNWQIAPRWVAGIEGDIGIADQGTTRGSLSFSPGFVLFALPPDSLKVNTTWDASLRGRFGFLLTPATLAYATGGVAWQHLEMTSTCISVGCFGNGQTPALISSATTQIGWTLGGGIETALDSHWLLRGEYRYADSGNAPFNIQRAATLTPGRNPIADSFNVALQTHTVTFGIAYKFGDAIAPAGDLRDAQAFATKAPAAATSWSGLYAGLGVGARATQDGLNGTAETFGGVPQSLTGRGGRQPFNSVGARANPYVGLNWQFAPQWVVGLEGDAGFADQIATLKGYPFSPVFGTFHSAADSLAVKTTWDASVRARLGFLVNATTLVYGTGGIGWQHQDVTSTCGSAACTNQFNLGPSVISQATTKAGSTVGAGIETILGGHWLSRAEYRYADFGTAHYSVGRTSTFAGNNNVDSFDVAMRTHLATFGLAYKFN
jgi:outer membrane immunogenic protein